MGSLFHIIDMETREILDEFTETFMPKDFRWRKGQRETIEQVIETYTENTHRHVIVEAPTGSGKAIIAMASSYVLNKMNKKGFILTSELTLQDQYESDLNRYMLRWGSVKGIDNYECLDNDERHSLGTCKINGINPRKMQCYDQCPYFSARDHAATTMTSALNYAYWLIQMNYVNPKNEDPLFPPREFLMCDEAHKVVEIVQNHFSPRITEKTTEKIERLYKFFNMQGMRDLSREYVTLKRTVDKIWKERDKHSLLDLLHTVERNLIRFKNPIETLRERVKEESMGGKPPKEWREAFYIGEWIKDLHCKVEDYNEIIGKTGLENMVKNPKGEDEVVFNCLEENYLMNNHFHEWSNFTVYLSATFSDPKSYAHSLGIKGAKYLRVGNNFSFRKSPIYFWNKRRMSKRYVEDNIPWMTEKVNGLLDIHREHKGIIHTASYELSNRINEGLSQHNLKRMLVYSGTEEKRDVLETLKREKNRVLMGPSLTTGLDLKNDLCRFIIFAKVPYPSLHDEFVKAKMKKNPEWYRWKTIVEILQASGRGIRSEDDWAITYLLDANFGDLLHHNRKYFPWEFVNRIKLIK